MTKLINPAAIEGFLTSSMAEHFMSQQDVTDYMDGEEFSLVKLMTLFNDLIANKFAFFFDPSQTNELLEELKKGPKGGVGAAQKAKSWLDALFPEGNLHEFDLLVFLFF